MANDLVRQSNWPEAKDKAEEQEWDLPPEYQGQPERPERDAQPIHDHRSEAGAQQAERDATAAQQRGDTTFKALREADGADLRQNRWGRGDLRTWLIIAAMFFGFLLFSAFVYYMPQGRHNQTDDTVINGRAPTPQIRVY